MDYSVLATSKTPALIIFVLDVSGSMTQSLGGRRRLDVVTEALATAIRQMAYRATKGSRVEPRYRFAIFAYSDHVYDLLDGIKTIDYVAGLGVPELQVLRNTDTAKAFKEVEKLLQSEIVNLSGCPAPLVCHITDGEYTGDDPEPVAKRIINMKTTDGNVLLENLFISESILPQPIQDVRQWEGVLASTSLINKYAIKLRSMSSILPESYRGMMLEAGYQIKPDAYMMLPGSTRELVEMGFVMASSTR